MNVLQSLTELYNSQDQDSIFKELSRRILRNLDQMRRITIYDVAELTNSSRTTVWRLVQKLGYQSFSDFKFALQSASSQYVYYNRMMERKSGGDPEALLREIQTQMKDSVKVFTEKITGNELEQWVDQVAEAGRVHFYLPFRSAMVYSFQQNLWMGGKDTEYCCLIPEMLEAARSLNESSLVLMSTIEFTETMDMTEVFQTIRARGGKIWLMGNAESNYEQYAERRIMMSDANPATWLLAFESFILALSERYRQKYIDKKPHSSPG